MRSLVGLALISAALGGYIAGRLRTKWTGTHTHEVFFRDTAHGLITWSVATVFVAWVVAGSAAGAAGQAAAVPAGAATQGPASTQMTYQIDRLFRPGSSGGSGASGAEASGTEAVPAQNASDARGETLYIAYHAAAMGSVPDADKSYLAELVSAQAGVTSAEARRRVDDFVSAILSAADQAKAELDKARKAAAQASIYMALSLLVGAFIASVAAAIGGHLRDLQQH